MAAVSNCEISKVHHMQLEITIGNIPRHHSNCAYKKHINLTCFNDNSVFSHFKPYTLKYGTVFQPVCLNFAMTFVQHSCSSNSKE